MCITVVCVGREADTPRMNHRLFRCGTPGVPGSRPAHHPQRLAVQQIVDDVKSKPGITDGRLFSCRVYINHGRIIHHQPPDDKNTITNQNCLSYYLSDKFHYSLT